MVDKNLSKLNPAKCLRVADIHPRVLQECHVEVWEALSKIFNNFICKGVPPRSWWKAQLTPIIKKGSKLKPEKYWTVSSTSVVEKVWELLIKDQVMRHMESNHLRAKHPFMTKLLEAVRGGLISLKEEVILIINAWTSERPWTRHLIRDWQISYTHTVYVQYILGWIKCLLSGRNQRVNVENTSERFPGASGVPQDPVLGLILFLFLSTIYRVFSNYIWMIADDTKIDCETTLTIVHHLKRIRIT